jgi:hypothetical protein
LLWHATETRLPHQSDSASQYRLQVRHRSGDLRDFPGANISEGTLLDPEIHYLPSHKQAVCKIMATVLTASCWENVMQHMTTRGTRSSKNAGSNEGDVLRFLNDGISLADLPSVFQALNETGPVAKPPVPKRVSGINISIRTCNTEVHCAKFFRRAIE